MKISVSLTVDLENPADWTTAFGIEDRTEIRKDVKEYVLGLVRDAGVFGNGEVPAQVTLR